MNISMKKQQHGAFPPATIALLLTTLLLPAFQLSAGNIDYVDAPEDGVELGLGWDMATGSLVPSRCVRFAPVQEGGQILTLDLSEVTDSSELAENLDVSASTSLKGMIGSASAKAKFVRNGNVKASSTTFSLRATAQNGTLFAGPLRAPENRRYAFTSTEKQLIPIWMQDGSDDDEDLSVRLEEWATDLLKKDNGKMAFRKACGDHYVSTIKSGAELLAVITFSTSDATKKEALSASIKGSYSIASASASVDLDHSEQATSSNLQVSYLQVGGARGAIPTTNDDLKRKLTVLANEAADAPVFFEIGIESYEDLPNWPSDPDESMDHDELMELMSDRDLDLYTLYRHLESVISLPGDYSINADGEQFQPRLAVLAELQDRILRVRSLIADFQEQRHILESELLRGEPLGDTKKLLQAVNTLTNIKLPDVNKAKLKPAAKDYHSALINMREYLENLNVPKIRLWLPLPSHIGTPDQAKYAKTLVQFYLGTQARRICERRPNKEGCLDNATLREMEFDVLPNYHQLKLRGNTEGYLFSTSDKAPGCLSASADYKATRIVSVSSETTDLDSAQCTEFKFAEENSRFYLATGDHLLALDGTRVFLNDGTRDKTSEWSVLFNNKLGIDVEGGTCMTAESASERHIGAATCSKTLSGWFFVPKMLLPL